MQSINIVPSVPSKFRGRVPFAEQSQFAQQYFLVAGITRDSGGAALANCDVHLFRTSDDVELQQAVSDANGAFVFYVGPGVAHYMVAYKTGVPDVTGASNNTVGFSLLVDSCSETIQNTSQFLDSGDDFGVAQSFTGDDVSLGSCKFYLKKSGSPTGNAVARLYEHTGTFGTSSIPGPGGLVTSDNFDVSTLTTSFALTNFNFSGANQYAMVNGTKYCITIEYSGGDASNQVIAGTVNRTTAHDGNLSYLDSFSVWNADAIHDLCFYVYSK